MPKLVRSAPYFPVADVDATSAFYRDVLGFQIEYTAGSPMQFAICTRDGFSIMLRRVESPEEIRPIEAQGGTWDAFFWVADILELHGEFQSRRATVAYGPILQEAFGMTEFAIRDCDGHVLGFGEPL
jgi:catechol 2,3-dioxygenase-like lactoylglutathione lyase family enzyme